MYADGHWPRRLSYSSGNAENIEGAWSPDGERIAFTGCTDGSSGSCAVTVTGWQAWQPLRLAGAMTFGPAWSPDGSRLALWSSHTNTVYLMDADGRNVRELAAGRDPAWMPDGRIAFWAGGPDAYRLVTLDPDDPAAGAQPAAGEIVVYDQQFFPWRPARWLASAGPLNPTGK